MNKHEFRQHARALRAKIAGREEKSHLIWASLLARFLWPDFGWVCSYVDIAPEVITEPYLKDRLSKVLPQSANREIQNEVVKLAVPYCLPQHLNLFHGHNWSELSRSKWGLQEPLPELRLPERLVAPEKISLFLVPGLAFDRSGNRLGYGKGYYDKLLAQRRPGSLAIALAFHEQIATQVPHDPAQDIAMDYIVTEREVIDCRSER